MEIGNWVPMTPLNPPGNNVCKYVKKYSNEGDSSHELFILISSTFDIPRKGWAVIERKTFCLLRSLINENCHLKYYSPTVTRDFRLRLLRLVNNCVESICNTQKS